MENQTSKPSKKGFASMSPERRKEVASSGGKKAHKLGVAHEFNKEEASVAGKKGGTLLSQRPGYMAELGRKGGNAASKVRRAKKGGI